MNNFKRIVIMIIACIGLVSIGKVSRADGGPLPSIHSLFQQGEGVDVTLKLYGPSARDLNRRGEDQEWVTVFENHAFDVNDALEFEVSCWEWPVEYYDCEVTPEQCGDCDDDGIYECVGDCITEYHFVYFDECVAPGYTEYGLMIHGEFFSNTKTIEVEDVGQECDDGSDIDSDGDTDDGEANSDPDDVSDSDCSVSKVGSNNNISAFSTTLFETLLLLINL